MILAVCGYFFSIISSWADTTTFYTVFLFLCPEPSLSLLLRVRRPDKFFPFPWLLALSTFGFEPRSWPSSLRLFPVCVGILVTLLGGTYPLTPPPWSTADLCANVGSLPWFRYIFPPFFCWVREIPLFSCTAQRPARGVGRGFSSPRSLSFHLTVKHQTVIQLWTFPLPVASVNRKRL